MIDISTFNGPEILTTAEMYQADSQAISGGVPGITLMENAGRAVADHIMSRWARRETVVLCGPGNNGGDGFVIARLLADAGWQVTLGLLGDKGRLKGDAAEMAQRWQGDVAPLAQELIADASLVVDAVFGAGLDRPVTGDALHTLQAMAESGVPVVAVDVPSGIQGDSGAVLGFAVPCHSTVTFFRPKPGHFLLPGKQFAGEVKVADIGIPDSVLAEIEPATCLNGPDGWGTSYPWPDADDHKYGRGHLVLIGGAEMTGAARLAARAAMRAGSGLVTIAAPPSAVPVYASDLPVFLIAPVANAQELDNVLADKRKNAALIGPGCGLGLITRQMALTLLEAGLPTVLDADAITVFSDNPGVLFETIEEGNAVLTPHEGEFARLFDVSGDKVARARAAAERSGAVILLKGADTVIAAPDGRVAINANAPSWLATAGAGDVLAGLIGGLIAQRVPPFEASCMAAWLHGAAAAQFGPGLIASDLPGIIPDILRELYESRG